MAKAVLSEKGGSIFLSCFGVPFFAVGCLIIYFMLLAPLKLLKESPNWIELDAQVTTLEFDFEPKSGVKAKPFKIVYEYNYQDKKYASSEIYLDSSFAKIEVQKEIVAKCQKGIGSEALITIYVNPENPQQSVIFREFYESPVTMGVFGGVFAIIGLGIIIAGFLMFKSVSLKERLKVEAPDKPWMWHKDWRQGIVKPERKSNLVIGLIFLCFWYGMAGIPAIVLYEDFLNGTVLTYVCGGMMVLGILFIYFYIKSIFRYRKYGQSYLDLKTLPGRLGEEFEAEVYAPFFLKPEGDIHFKLTCKRHYTEGAVDSRRSKTDELFSERFTVESKEAKSMQEALIIPVKFLLPEDKPVSSDDGIFWTLSAYAETVGLDWAETYNIPVFK